MQIPISGTSVISPQGQLTLPAKIREATDLKPGDVISWLVIKAKEGYKQLIVLKQPKDWIEETCGIAKDLYGRVGGGENYLKEEKKDWD